MRRQAVSELIMANGNNQVQNKTAYGYNKSSRDEFVVQLEESRGGIQAPKRAADLAPVATVYAKVVGGPVLPRFFTSRARGSRRPPGQSLKRQMLSPQ
jgi:hypothetical protein